MEEDPRDALLRQLADEVRNMKMVMQGSAQDGKAVLRTRAGLLDKTNYHLALTVVCNIRSAANIRVLGRLWAQELSPWKRQSGSSKGWRSQEKVAINAKERYLAHQGRTPSGATSTPVVTPKKKVILMTRAVRGDADVERIWASGGLAPFELPGDVDTCA